VALSEGDLIEVDADRAAGHEQQGRQPVLVVSVNALQSALGLAMVCAVTTHGGRAESARNDLDITTEADLAAAYEGIAEAILGQHIRPPSWRHHQRLPASA
jgi:mRNA-degrading endonuclease toxin of MazEF toxin-antitoxin module